MVELTRHEMNPLIEPDKKSDWASVATFNGCPIKQGNNIHMLYRAIGVEKEHHGVRLSMSTIGCATSRKGVHFTNHRQLIKPERDWEMFGCEDPRVTRIGKVGKKYYIFYTALSTWPLTPAGIKIGMAVTEDFESLEGLEKHSVTHFNSKAMTLFPNKINKKITAMLTVNTDLPPSKICIAQFEEEKDMWSHYFWEKWRAKWETHALPMRRRRVDQVEIGAPPVRTKRGWLIIYSYIRDYLAPPAKFGIEALLLDKKNPMNVIARTTEPLLVPKTEYELYGTVPNVIFPSGALVVKKRLHIYYGAADTTVCLATCDLKELLDEIENTPVHKVE